MDLLSYFPNIDRGKITTTVAADSTIYTMIATKVPTFASKTVTMLSVASYPHDVTATKLNFVCTMQMIDALIDYYTSSSISEDNARELKDKLQLILEL